MTKTETIEKTLHEELIEFAKRHKQIKAIFKGTDPEVGGLAYYFLTGINSRIDMKLEDRITELDIKIQNSLIPKEAVFNLYSWPVNPEDAHEKYGFIEELIWER